MLISEWVERYDSSKDFTMEENIEEVIVVSLLCEEAEKEERNKTHSIWVHDIPNSRYEEGEYHTLFPRLLKDPDRFHTNLRMSKEKFYELLQIIKPHIEQQDTNFRRAIGVEERLMVTMRFLATGDSFRTIGESYRLGYTTVQEIVHTTCSVIWEVLSKIVMPEPTEETWRNAEGGFSQRWNFPNCIAAMDGKHIKIQAPPNSGSLYFNYKKYFSVVLLALVDANYKFLIVYVGELGKNSDGGIFSRSVLAKRLETNTLNIPGPKSLPGTSIQLPHVIVGDEAFPLKPYLMRPYPGSQLQDKDNKIYNYRHSRARRVSENAFGILSQKFRLYYRTINLSPENVDNVILATCCLHNFLRDDPLHFNDEKTPTRQLQLLDLPRIGGNFTSNAFEVRDKLKEYFNSTVGSLPWQTEMIRRGCRQRE